MTKHRSGIVIIALSLAVVVAVAVISPFLYKKDSTESASSQKGNVPLLSAKGVVESPDDVEIGSQAAGIVNTFYIKEGDTVKKGEKLLSLDDSKILNQLERARAATREASARLAEVEAGSRHEDMEMAAAKVNRAAAIHAQAREEYLKQDRLLKKEATTGFEHDRAYERMTVAANELSDMKASLQRIRSGERAESVEQAKASRDRAASEERYYRTLLNEHVILAPCDGVIMETYKKRGEYIDVGTPILRIVNPANLRIRAEVDETDVGKVVEGQQVEVLSDAFKDKSFPGTVYQVFRNVKKKSQKTFDPIASFDINTQTFFVRLASYQGLQAGMTVTVRVKP